MNKIFEVAKMDYYISGNVFSKRQTPLRKTEKYEIELYTTTGNTSVINGISHAQKIGNVLVAKPGDLRYSIDSFECYCVHFSCSDADTAAALNTLPDVFSPADTEAVKRIFMNFLASKDFDGISKTLFIQGNLMELISLLLSENTQKYCGRYEQYLSDVFMACDYMEHNYEQHITLADIAAAVNLSPGFFHNVFKSIKGVTPAEYLVCLRIEHAKDMLRRSALPLAEIAILCGFGSQGYFNYVFKKKTGLTPKGYRDKKQIII